jgi:hypothetical protein
MDVNKFNLIELSYALGLDSIVLPVLITHLHLVPMLRINTVILHVFGGNYFSELVSAENSGQL